MPPDKPRRAHHLVLDIGADTQTDLIAALESIIFDIHRGSRNVTSGGYSSGWTMTYTVDEAITHDVYFEHVDTYLKAVEAADAT